MVSSTRVTVERPVFCHFQNAWQPSVRLTTTQLAHPGRGYIV